jgi:hypothetical protein
MLDGILTGIGIFLLAIIAILYFAPMLCAWFMIIKAIIIEGVHKRDHWLVWLFVFLSFVPIVNIVLLIGLIYSKHDK